MEITTTITRTGAQIWSERMVPSHRIAPTSSGLQGITLPTAARAAGAAAGPFNGLGFGVDYAKTVDHRSAIGRPPA